MTLRDDKQLKASGTGVMDSTNPPVLVRDDIIVLPSGFELAVRIWGDPQASPDQPQHRWLALHGWADNAASFDRLAPMLVREGAACVVAIDAAGHGLSGHRPTYHDVDNVRA